MKNRSIRRFLPALLIAAAVPAARAQPAFPPENLTVTISIPQEASLTAAERQDLQDTIQSAVRQSLRGKTGGGEVNLRFTQEAPAEPQTPEEITDALAVQREIRAEMLTRLALAERTLEKKITADPIAVHLKLIIRRLEVRYHNLAEIFEGNLIKAHEVEDVEEHLLAARIELARHIRSLQRGPESEFIAALRRQIFERTVQITELEMRLRQLSPDSAEPAPSDTPAAEPPPPPSLKLAQK